MYIHHDEREMEVILKTYLESQVYHSTYKQYIVYFTDFTNVYKVHLKIFAFK